jgi:hypothetical protein
MLVVIGVSQFYLIFNIMSCGENMCDIKIYFKISNTHISHMYGYLFSTKFTYLNTQYGLTIKYLKILL